MSKIISRLNDDRDQDPSSFLKGLAPQTSSLSKCQILYMGSGLTMIRPGCACMSVTVLAAT